MRPASKPWQQVTALVSLSAGGAITGFSFVPKTTADLTSPTSTQIRLLALKQAAAPSPADDATLRSAIVNVASYYLRMAQGKTPAEMEAIIWQHDSIDGVDHGESCAAFASLTLELAAQVVGRQSWVTGGTSYPWPLHKWADVRVDPNQDSPGITSVLQDAQAHHRWHPAGDGYQPLPGDWVLFDGHVEVVTKYAGGVLHTIGGDSLPNFSVNAHEYRGPLGSHGVMGFVDNGELAATAHPAPAPAATAGTATAGEQGAAGEQRSDHAPTPTPSASGKAQSGAAQSGAAQSGAAESGQAHSARAQPGLAAIPGVGGSGPTTAARPANVGLPATRPHARRRLAPRRSHPSSRAAQGTAACAAVPGTSAAGQPAAPAPKASSPTTAPAPLTSTRTTAPAPATSSPTGTGPTATAPATTSPGTATPSTTTPSYPTPRATRPRATTPRATRTAAGQPARAPGSAEIPGVSVTARHAAADAAAPAAAPPATPAAAPPAAPAAAATAAPTAPYSRRQSAPAAAPVSNAAAQQAFITQVAPGAMATQRRYGVPAAVTIAQAIDESAWGTSVLATRDHNLFGIKGTGPAGRDLLPTQEYANGEALRSTAVFRVYHDVTESIDDHGKLLASSEYYGRAMADRQDPNAFAEALTGVYATDPTYGTKLVALMREYDLYRYDTTTPATPAAPATAETPAAPAPAPSASAPPASAPPASAPAASAPAASAPATPTSAPPAPSPPVPAPPSAPGQDPGKPAAAAPAAPGGAAIPGLPTTTVVTAAAPDPVTATVPDAWTAPAAPRITTESFTTTAPLGSSAAPSTPTRARAPERRARTTSRYQSRMPVSVRSVLTAAARPALVRGEPLYRDIAGDSGIAWELLAACDWMQCEAQPRYSPVHGEKLGSVNPDGTSYRTRSAALEQCANDLVALARAVYGIDLTAPDDLSVRDLAKVFAAFRWGGLLKLHHTSAMEFPYSVAGLTAEHLNMRWPKIAEPHTPDKPGGRFRMPFGAVPIVLSLNYPATV